MTKKDIFDKLLIGCEHDGSFIPVSEVKRLMKETAKNIFKETDNIVEGWIDPNGRSYKDYYEFRAKFLQEAKK